MQHKIDHQAVEMLLFFMAMIVAIGGFFGTILLGAGPWLVIPVQVTILALIVGFVAHVMSFKEEAP